MFEHCFFFDMYFKVFFFHVCVALSRLGWEYEFTRACVIFVWLKYKLLIQVKFIVKCTLEKVRGQQADHDSQIHSCHAPTQDNYSSISRSQSKKGFQDIHLRHWLATSE